APEVGAGAVGVGGGRVDQVDWGRVLHTTRARRFLEQRLVVEGDELALVLAARAAHARAFLLDVLDLVANLCHATREVRLGDVLDEVPSDAEDAGSAGAPAAPAH